MCVKGVTVIVIVSTIIRKMSIRVKESINYGIQRNLLKYVHKSSTKPIEPNLSFPTDVLGS